MKAALLITAALIAFAGPASAQSAVVEVQTGGHEGMVIFWTADRKVGFGTTRDWHSAPRLDRVTIPAIYDWSNGFSNGSAAVRVAGKYGLIDPAGAAIAPARFDWIERCERGFAVTYSGGKAGLWNCTTRKEQIAPRFGALQLPGQDGLAGAADVAGLWGLVRMDGTWSAQPLNLMLVHQENGLTSTFNKGVWRMISSDGTVLEEGGTSLANAGKTTYVFKDPATGKFGIKTAANVILAPAEFRSILCANDRCIGRETSGYVLLNAETGARITSTPIRFLTGAAPFVASDAGGSGPFYYVGRNGERLFGRAFDRASRFNEQGLAVVQSGGKAGVIDRTGKLVLPFQYDVGNGASVEITERHMFARRDGCWGATDLQGREVLPFTFMDHMAYENSNPFETNSTSGFHSVSGCKPQVGRTGSAVFDADLKPVLALGTYDSINPTEQYRWSNNSWVIHVKKGGLEGVYDLTARRELVRPQWRRTSASDEYLLIFDEPGGTKGYAYESGRVLSPNNFDFVSYVPEAKAWIISRPGGEGSLFGIADMNGKVIVPPKFPGSMVEIGLFYYRRAGVFTARTKDRTGFLGPTGQTILPFNYDRYFLGKQWGDFIYGNTVPLPQGGRLVLVDAEGKVLVRSEDFGLRNATYIRPMMFGRKRGFVATFPRSSGKGTHDRLILDGVLYEAAGGNIGSEEIKAEFNEGLMAVRINGKFGYLDVMGNMAIAPQFDKAGRFIFGLASATANDKIFPINRTGEQVKVATTQLVLAMKSDQAD